MGHRIPWQFDGEEIIRDYGTPDEDWVCEMNHNENERTNANLIVTAVNMLPEVKRDYESMMESICSLCKRLNPQHKNCTSCPEIESYQDTLKKLEAVDGN